MSTKRNTSLAAQGALAHRLRRRTACKIHKGAPKWPAGSGKVSTPRFRLNKFFDPSTPSMRKGRDGEEEKTGKKGEKTDDYRSHYVIASSRPPKRRPLERRPLVPIWTFSTFSNLSFWIASL